MNLFGIDVRTSPHCYRQAPIRKHRHRRNQSAAYHKRVQKKWAKRFGTKKEPVAYMVDMRYLGGIGNRMVIPPECAAMLKSFSV